MYLTQGMEININKPENIISHIIFIQVFLGDINS